VSREGGALPRLPRGYKFENWRAQERTGIVEELRALAVKNDRP
jgi:hypothetical protein